MRDHRKIIKHVDSMCYQQTKIFSDTETGGGKRDFSSTFVYEWYAPVCAGTYVMSGGCIETRVDLK